MWGTANILSPLPIIRLGSNLRLLKIEKVFLNSIFQRGKGVTRTPIRIRSPITWYQTLQKIWVTVLSDRFYSFTKICSKASIVLYMPVWRSINSFNRRLKNIQSMLRNDLCVNASIYLLSSVICLRIQTNCLYFSFWIQLSRIQRTVSKIHNNTDQRFRKSVSLVLSLWN